MANEAATGLDGKALPEARVALDEAERSGFRIMMVARSAVMAFVVGTTLYNWFLYDNPTGVLLSVPLLLAGLAALRALGTRFERQWHRYAVLALDIAAITAAALLLPLVEGGGVPRIFVFRAFSTAYLFFILILSSLTLAPRLVLFTGAAVTASLWTVYLVAAADLEVQVNWSNLPRNATAEQFIALVLDPDFTGLANRVQESVVLVIGAVVLAAAVQRARRAVIRFAEAERGRQRAEGLFGRYVPAAVARSILDSPAGVSPTMQTGSALFLDIEGFTRFAAERPPEMVLQALDSFLALVTEAITAERGVPIVFGGDSVLATFGVPLPTDDCATSAVAAARRVLDRLEQARFDGVRFEVRIGIATGPIAAGTVGGNDRQSFTVYGATVNLAQRLEAANKLVGTRLLICEHTLASATLPAEAARLMDPLPLPGFLRPVRAATLTA